MKSEEQKSRSDMVKNVLNRRHFSAQTPIEISHKRAVETAAKKKDNSPIPPNFKCSLNEYLAAVVDYHDFYFNVPAKTIAKIALNLIFAVSSKKQQQNSNEPIFDGILTFDHFSVICPNEFEFGDEELAGNLKIEFNETLEKVKDPRERTLSPEQRAKKQIIWLKDVLFMSPEQIKDNRSTTLGKDLVWFVGLLFYRMLFNNKHPMDNWEPKRRLDMEFMAKMGFSGSNYFYMYKRDDFVPGYFRIVPLKPKSRWIWMPESGRDETGEMALVEERIGMEQDYIVKLRSIVSETLQNNQIMSYSYSPRFNSNQEDEGHEKLIELNKMCLQTFADYRISFSFMVELLEYLAN
ncbi:hypothetical protein niasHT_010590 [Heterodera trifolii]|uniref:Uncharacterized protein n=1 Tax=Heterodera trifolii TaxID=157864 RepID=A0ABD2L2B3_9BILA